MKTQIASATKIINALADKIYKIIADYRNSHPLILPKPYFLSLDVEEGGFGEGTIVRFQMRILGQTQNFRALISEPEPGGILQETDISSGVMTRFVVSPLTVGAITKVTISTELKDRGLVEGFIARAMLQRIYARELDLIASVAGAK